MSATRPFRSARGLGTAVVVLLAVNAFGGAGAVGPPPPPRPDLGDRGGLPDP